MCHGRPSEDSCSGMGNEEGGEDGGVDPHIPILNFWKCLSS